ncbi:hypothetical protein HPP92_019894, partial [Vanilla planifolia]
EKYFKCCCSKLEGNFEHLEEYNSTMVIFVDIICSSNSVILADKEIAFSFARGTTIDVAPVPIRFGLGSRAASTNLEFWVRRCIKTVMQPGATMPLGVMFKRLLHARRLDANFVPTVALWDVDSQRRGSLIIRRLCVLLEAERVYREFSTMLEDENDLEFASIMVQAHDHASAVILSLVEEDIDVKFLKVRQVGTRLLGASICLLEVAVVIMEERRTCFELLEPGGYPWLLKALYSLLMLLPQRQNKEGNQESDLPLAFLDTITKIPLLTDYKGGRKSLSRFPFAWSKSSLSLSKLEGLNFLKP